MGTWGGGHMGMRPVALNEIEPVRLDTSAGLCGCELLL
jgi:hypothetical protein